ncbi:hypothetical protein EV130_12042 [Rhizobium azibense]|uniref:Uncharacterized protein n=1 Tax=Rhizobium azibense TaxID=1136135 RepID=A0A4R3Q3D8_9HYPH|nr:hypothetical protein EV130_12042 [Rhizobium azibense]
MCRTDILQRSVTQVAGGMFQGISAKCLLFPQVAKQSSGVLLWCRLNCILTERSAVRRSESRIRLGLNAMTRRLKYLILLFALSLLMWSGVISGTLWVLSDGTDYSFTAGTR